MTAASGGVAGNWRGAGALGARRREGAAGTAMLDPGAGTRAAPVAAAEDGRGEAASPGARSRRSSQSMGASPVASSAPMARYHSSTATSSNWLLSGMAPRATPHGGTSWRHLISWHGPFPQDLAPRKAHGQKPLAQSGGPMRPGRGPQPPGPPTRVAPGSHRGSHLGRTGGRTRATPAVTPGWRG